MNIVIFARPRAGESLVFSRYVVHDWLPFGSAAIRLVLALFRLALLLTIVQGVAAAAPGIDATTYAGDIVVPYEFNGDLPDVTGAGPEPPSTPLAAAPGPT